MLFAVFRTSKYRMINNDEFYRNCRGLFQYKTPELAWLYLRTQRRNQAKQSISTRSFSNQRTEYLCISIPDSIQRWQWLLFSSGCLIIISGYITFRCSVDISFYTVNGFLTNISKATNFSNRRHI
jgi:hypothetical protein